MYDRAKDIKDIANEMERYIRDIKEQDKINHERIVHEAREALRRTGVTDEKGNTKEKIVTWE